MRLRRFAKGLLCSLALSAVCGLSPADEMPAPVARTVDFAADVHPLLEARCAACHGGDSRKGGFSIGSRDTVLKGSESGTVVVEGKSAESRLIRLVSGLDPDLVMPPKGERLSADEVGILRAWIDQGLKWELKKADSPAWQAPLAPRRPDVPIVEGVAHPIDRFLAAYLQTQSIPAGAPVSDAVFARRAYLDATGLLPTPEQLTAFLNDAAPDKYAKLVDTLLSDRQTYAEHWISFWNDALRNDFSGTGYIDGGRKQITPWLYDALFQDLPYNQFVTQLVNPTPANDGFANGIVWRGSVTAAETPAMQAGRSIAQVFLGVNLKCASCHDSFINEWKLADAYGMANVFSEKPLELVRCDTPTGKMAETKFLWPEIGALDPNRSVSGRRAQLAGLVTSEANGRFARTVVNRLWARLMGRGLVEPLDDMGQQPWNADLLDWLACDLVDSGYDLKATLRRIMTSQAYRMPSVRSDPAVKPYVFGGPEVRRLSAEEFLDALSSLTGVWQTEPQFALPGVQDGPIRAWRANSDPLTRALGRPNREQVTTRRDEQATTLQALELSNGATFSSMLKEGADRLTPEAPSAAELAKRLYLHALQREPSQDELQTACELLGEPVTREGMEDFLWALAMLPEFQYL